MILRESSLLEAQVKYWRELVKPTLNKSLEISPHDKLNWAPAPRMITLGNIFLHIAECSDWWYEEVMNQHKATELAPNPNSPISSKADIAKHLDAHWQRLERLFAESPETLRKSFKVAGGKKIKYYNGYWIFTHLLEHDIHHRSQINQYLRILGIIPPGI